MQKKILFSIISLLIITGSVSAQSKADSINRLISKEKDLSKKNALLLERAKSFDKKDSLKAFSDVRNAMDYYKKNNSSDGMTDSYNALGVIYLKLSNFSKAYQNDSLALNLSVKNNYTEGRVDALFNLGVLQKKQGKYEDAEKLFTESLALLKSLKSADGEKSGRIYNELGAVKSTMGKYGEALELIDRAIELGKDSDNKKLLIASYINYANTFTRIAEYEQSVQYHLKAIRLAEEINDSIQIFKEYNNLAITYKQLQEFEKAIFYFKKCLDLASLSYNYKSMGLASTNLAVAYAENRQLEKLDTLYDSALIAFKKAHDVMGQALVYHNYGNYLLGMKNYGKAEENLLQALKLRKEAGIKPAIASTLSVLGKLELEQDRLFEAEKYLKEAEGLMSGDEESIDTLSDLYIYLKELYIKKEDYKKATEYQEKLLEINQKKFDRDEKINSLKLQVEYELEKKDHAFKAEKETERRRQIYIFSIVGFVLLILILFLIVLLQRRKQISDRHNAELMQLRQQHRLSLADSLTKAEQEERKKIAHKLHDETAGFLSIARLNVEQLNENLFAAGTDAEAKLKATQKLLAEASESIRNISHSLMPVTLEKYGLKAALQDLVDSINISRKIKIEEVLEGMENSKSWNPQLNLTIYRMVQEVFNNIIKHAQATNVFLQVIELDDSVTIYIEDNGKGIQESKSSGDGIGLNLLKQNIEYLNGRVEINGKENKGTFVLAELPIILQNLS